MPNMPDVHHVIGKSQNHPQIISLFLQKCAGDPAIKVMVRMSNQKFNHINLLLGLHSETQRSPFPLHQSSFVSGSSFCW
jgi:hypothetical protein